MNDTIVARTSNERLAAMLAHGATVFAWFLAPLLVYMITRTTSRYAAFHAMQALLWSLAGTVVSLATCGAAIPVFLVFHIIAAVKVWEGQDYEYPIIGEAARNVVPA